MRSVVKSYFLDFITMEYVVL